MRPETLLPAANFFMADVGGGLGPYMATWLHDAGHWGPDRVGYVLTTGNLVFMLLSSPAGALLDRFGRPRLFLAGACLAIVLGTLALLPFHTMLPVLIAQALVAMGGAIGGPALMALTLGIVGKRRFPRQQGTNEAANHAGNVAAAGLAYGLSLLMGATAPFAVLSGMAAFTLLTLWAMPADSVDTNRITGRDANTGRAQSMVALLLHGRLLRVALAISMFQLGNAAMLPLWGQKLAEDHAGDPTRWMSVCVIVSQLTMIPFAYLAGVMADRIGRRWLLILACCALPARGLLAAWAPTAGWTIPFEILDGIGAGLISVAAPAAIADLTYGGGRTQTAIGGVATMQGVATALSSSFGGLLARYLGWNWAFLALGAPPLIGVALLLTVRLQDETAAD